MVADRCPQFPPTSIQRSSPRRSEGAQATVEFLGVMPIVLLAATCCVQAFLVGCSLVFAQVAVGRVAVGAPEAQVVSALPAGWRSRATVERDGSRVTVRVAAPSVLPGTSRWLAVRASTELQP